MKTTMSANVMYGYSFTAMSDTFLIECFDELSERTANREDDELLDKWNCAKTEILKRMQKTSTV